MVPPSRNRVRPLAPSEYVRARSSAARYSDSWVPTSGSAQRAGRRDRADRDLRAVDLIRGVVLVATGVAGQLAVVERRRDRRTGNQRRDHARSEVRRGFPIPVEDFAGTQRAIDEVGTLRGCGERERPARDRVGTDLWEAFEVRRLDVARGWRARDQRGRHRPDRHLRTVQRVRGRVVVAPAASTQALVVERRRDHDPRRAGFERARLLVEHPLRVDQLHAATFAVSVRRRLIVVVAAGDGHRRNHHNQQDDSSKPAKHGRIVETTRVEQVSCSSR